MVDKPIFTCPAKEAVFRFTICMLSLFMNVQGFFNKSLLNGKLFCIVKSPQRVCVISTLFFCYIALTSLVFSKNQYK